MEGSSITVKLDAAVMLSYIFSDKLVLCDHSQAYT